MYWNTYNFYLTDEQDEINRNMRCIEISKAGTMLKFVKRINRNMRCIEMSLACAFRIGFFMINRNMRCIEINVSPLPVTTLTD